MTTKSLKKLRFSMRFDPMTIEHLGLRLYSTLPPVLSELVSNAYDAESPSVEVLLPKGPIRPTSEVVVRDYGHGMNAKEVQDEYLPIGRNRRGEDSSKVMSRNRKVRVTGRKGIGKLSAFGVASEVEIRSIRSGQAVCIRLRYEDIQSWTEAHETVEYEPDVIEGRMGRTRDKDGVEVRLRGLKRRRTINAEAIRKGLARRLTFIGSKFKLRVNGEEVQAGDRVRRNDCPEGYSWDVRQLPGKGAVTDDLEVRGWVGFVASSSQAVTDRGVDIFANGKAVELGSFFNFPSTHAQFARAHLVGEIHADFLDAGEDLVATARNSVVWESEPGTYLQEWGQRVLKWAFERWLEQRRRKKEEEITNVAGFHKWLATRSDREQSVARRIVKLLVDDEALEPESARRLLEIVKGSVEARAFEQLIHDLESEGANVATILRLFDEWRVIEAREHLKLADGRLSIIDKLERFLKTGALEVRQLQPLFERNLWLIDSSWVEAEGQTTYTRLLREHFKESRRIPEEDRRIDILGVRHSSDLTVVEIKRPERTLTRKFLSQIEDYVDWARSQFVASDVTSPRYVRGLLVVGRLSSKAEDQEKRRRLEGSDIRVTTYADLHHAAKEYYGQVAKELKNVAPEYAERLRRKRSKQAK